MLPHSAAAGSAAGPASTGLPQLNGREVRLIASDIDGTILPYRSALSGLLSRRTVEAFQAARAAGIAVVLVTGRPVRGLRTISETLGTMGPVVASNGAVTYDLASDRVLSSAPLAAPTLFEAKDLLTSLDPRVTFAAETLRHLHLEESFARGSLWFEEERRRAVGLRDDDLMIGPLDHTLERATHHPVSSPQRPHVSGTVVKLLAKTRAYDPDAFLAHAQQSIGHLVTVTHSAPGVSLLEVSSQGVTKAQALRRYAEHHGIARAQTVAFGDMPNDVEMLQWAGTSWAVSSAHASARAAATHLAGSCEEDGVAAVIEQLLGGRLA